MMELWPFTNFHDLNLDWIIRTIKVYTKKVDDLYNFGLYDYVEKVLAAHPEWTTTVMDGSISTAKLADHAVTKIKMGEHINDLFDFGYQTTRYTDANGYATTIYYTNIDAEYKPKLKLANDIVNTVEEAGGISKRNKASICVNAGIFNTGTDATRGYVIADGVIYKATQDLTGEKGDILYMTDDGVLHAMDQNNAFATLQARDPVWAVQGWYAFVNGGTYTTTTYWTNLGKKPYSFIAQNATGDYLAGCCGGRGLTEEGLTVPELYDCITNTLGFTPEIAYLLDGGGSTSYLVDGVRVNTLVEGESRKIANCILWSMDDIVSDDIFNSNDIINTEIIDIQKKLEGFSGERRYMSAGDDMNDAKKPGIYYVSSNTIASSVSNIPAAKAGRLDVSYITGGTYYIEQYYTTYENVKYSRLYNQGTDSWTSWDIVVKYSDLTIFDNLETGTAVISGSDLNDYVQPGVYYSPDGTTTQSLSNCPITTGFVMTVRTMNGTFNANNKWNYMCREIFRLGHPEEIYRNYINSNGSAVYTAGSWYKFTGTAI